MNSVDPPMAVHAKPITTPGGVVSVHTVRKIEQNYQERAPLELSVVALLRVILATPLRLLKEDKDASIGVGLQWLCKGSYKLDRDLSDL